jgi:hypothetical protein
MQNSSNSVSNSQSNHPGTITLLLAAIGLPLLIVSTARPLGLDILLAFCEPLTALACALGSTAVLMFSSFGMVSKNAARVATFSLIFWVWLTYLVFHMHVAY